MLVMKLNEDGTICKASPTETPWYFMYVKHPNIHSKKFNQVFRHRFRLPFDQFLSFVAEAREERWFPRWWKWNSSPLELRVLGAFRYLGRGWTFDDLEELTAISQKVHRRFFYQFIGVGSKTLYL
jgi:hypothetical protein